MSEGADSGFVALHWTGRDRGSGADARGALERSRSDRVRGRRGQHRTAVDSDPAERLGRDRWSAQERAVGKPRFYRQQYPSRSGTVPIWLGECQRVTHRVSPPLSRLRSTAEIINSVTAPLPLSAQRHAHAETLVSKGPRAKVPPGPPEDVRSPGTASDWRRHTSCQ